MLFYHFKYFRHYWSLKVCSVTDIDDDGAGVDFRKHDIEQLFSIKVVNMRREQSSSILVHRFFIDRFVIEPQGAAASAQACVLLFLFLAFHSLNVPLALEHLAILITQIVKSHQWFNIQDVRLMIVRLWIFSLELTQHIFWCSDCPELLEHCFLLVIDRSV